MKVVLADIAVLGHGVVGSGVVEVLLKNSERIAENAGQRINVKYVLDIRKFPNVPYANLFVDDFEKIAGDENVSIVVETIGGVDAAYEYTKKLLKAGKSVVTSNKELVAAFGCELLKLAELGGVNYLFEASVGGGIPVIRPIAQCMSANRITEIHGILNGTTNYVLTEMVKNGTDFSAALSEAQKMGYAEADPSADIEGHDTCRKICILSSLALGRHIYPEQVPTTGIDTVTTADLRCAADLGYVIKLLGRARFLGGKVSAYVAPHLINKSNNLAGVSGVTNCVVVRGNAVGDVMFQGAGAGKMPTASAVAADVVDAAKHFRLRKLLGWGEGGSRFAENPLLLESAWYIRANISKEKALKHFGRIIFAENTQNADGTAFITPVMSGKTISEVLGADITPSSIFRVLSDY